MARRGLAVAALTATPAFAQLRGTVVLDRNGNGVADPGERGIAGVVVSNQRDVVRTDADGRYAFDSAPTGVVALSLPDGYRAPRGFWQPAGERNDFALQPVPRVTRFHFVHASDPHVSPAALPRMARFRALVDSVGPAFVLLSGDLVRDALRVGEAEATGYYELFAREIAPLRAPVHTVPGNHELFGIERDTSGVPVTHPLFNRGMYRRYRGPDYYSFTYGGVHFVALNTVDVDDRWYHGHVDAMQLDWLARDLAMIPPTMPVVTFNHIPFFTAVETVNGFRTGPPAPTPITIDRTTYFRHAVRNAGDVLRMIGTARLPLALGGHGHVRERLSFDGIPTRFHQAAAIVAPSGGAGLTFPSGITVYRVTRGRIDDGTFVPLTLWGAPR